jgi:hypothetical protein
MFTIGFVRNNEVYATLRGWLHQSVAQVLCDAFNEKNLTEYADEIGEYDHTIIIEIKD